MIAHRGASAYAPENTMAAFIKAAQLGVKWIEFDVMSASCGKPIIFHDEQLARTTHAQGNVNQFSYSYLATLDAGSWFNPMFAGERIPSLETMIEFLKKTGLSANIELKPLAGDEEVLVKRVLDEIKEHLSLTDGRILFSSFSIAALRFLRKYSRDCQIGLLMDEWMPDWQKISASLDCISIHVNHKIVTPDLTNKIKSQDYALFCYTVNEASRARELYSWGVDALFSDVPDKIMVIAPI